MSLAKTLKKMIVNGEIDLEEARDFLKEAALEACILNQFDIAEQLSSVVEDLDE